MESQIRNKSTVTAKWVFKNKETEIESAAISHIILDYDYDNNNMPILLMILNLKTSLYNKMVNNVSDASMYLKIMSYNYSEANPSKKTILEEQFRYYIPNDNDTNEELAAQAEKQTGDEQAYSRVTIGLIKQSVLDDNKKFFKDCVYRNINRNTLMYLGLKHVKKLCIRTPETKNKMIDQIIMPPLTSVNEYLAYIDITHGIYELGYRYFHDYKITYMLDESGTYVSDGTGEYKNVFIEVNDNLNMEVAKEGYFADAEKSMYTIKIPAINSPIQTDNVTETKVSNIIGVELDGVTGKAEVGPSNKEKAIYSRTPYNSKRINFMAKKYKNAVTISKSQFDGSVITPNKVYTIKNYDKYSAMNGSYVLYRKQIVFSKVSDNFIPTTSISLRKRL